MDPMKSPITPATPGILARVRNSKGFSLIEMAIVLVIIGIIIAAIVKGQDLMVNARAKQMVSAANSWKASVLAYTDRNGRFPGDNDKSGSIGDVAGEQSAGNTATDEIAATLTQAPANPIQVGGQAFWFYIGNAPATVGTRNVMVVCKAAACDVALTIDYVEIMKAFDTAIDGLADGGKGQVRALSAASDGTTIITGLAAATGRANGVATAPVTPNVTAAGAALPWSTAQFGAIWAFDKPY